MVELTRKISIVAALLLSITAVSSAVFAGPAPTQETIYSPSAPTPTPPLEYDQYGRKLPVPIAATTNDPPPANAGPPPGYGSPPPAYAPVPPPPPTYTVPPPVVYQAPVVLPAAPPQFVFVPELGYYVAMGVAFDMIFDGQSYYYHNGGYWYRTGYYGSAWLPVAPRMMPPLILKFHINDIHRFSTREFHRYKVQGARYKGKIHRPERREIKREERR